MLSSLHGPQHVFVVLLEERALHFKLLIDLASLAEVDELALIVAGLMPVVDIISVPHQSALAFD